MKICALVIWYKPDVEECIHNINTYNDKVDCLIIVDNSPFDNSNLISNFYKVHYISNKKNLGVAKALNIGCDYALKNGFDWCMTMDQDSYWDSDELSNYFRSIELLQYDLNNVSFAPNLKDIVHNTTSITGDIIRKLKKSSIPINVPSQNPSKVITSGNVINLSVWYEIGKFYEPFFIDEIDHEFCYRLKTKGLNITCFPNVYLNHKLGNPKKTFLPKRETHNGKRLYYMIRNMMYIKKMYPQFWESEKYASRIKRVILENLIRLNIKNLSFMFKGYLAGINNNFGE